MIMFELTVFVTQNRKLLISSSKMSDYIGKKVWTKFVAQFLTVTLKINLKLKLAGWVCFFQKWEGGGGLEQKNLFGSFH